MWAPEQGAVRARSQPATEGGANKGNAGATKPPCSRSPMKGIEVTGSTRALGENGLKPARSGR